MKMNQDFDPNQIVEQIYDIALDPNHLERFIAIWNQAFLDTQHIRRSFEHVDAFDKSFGAHLRRADAFLARNNSFVERGLEAALAPFSSAAAIIFDTQYRILAHNDGARILLNASVDGGLEDLPFATGEEKRFKGMVKTVLLDPGVTERLCAVEIAENARPVLFQVQRLPTSDQNGDPIVIAVSTQHHWQPALGDTLEEVYGLTGAEQVIVRSLLEGADAKSIAVTRGTSESTVRSQIKSILAKMNARSQTEIIRTALALRDVIARSTRSLTETDLQSTIKSDWLETEAWKPFKTVTLPDGRRMDYHDQGPPTGAPILMSHMGYGQARWSRRMLKLAYKHNLRIICPIRAGYGQSDNIARDADVVRSTREDTLFLLDHLGIDRLPYAPQSSDLLFAVDLAAEHPERVSEIIGLCARPSLKGDAHYAQMANWHRFFLSTAQHAPHLLSFTCRAAFSLARRIGVEQMFRNLNARSPSDIRMLDDPDHASIMFESASLVIGENCDAAQAYSMEVLAAERDWSDRMLAARGTPIRCINGLEDPGLTEVVIDWYREAYPWVTFETIRNAGQLMLFQHDHKLIPLLAKAAHQATKKMEAAV